MIFTKLQAKTLHALFLILTAVSLVQGDRGVLAGWFYLRLIAQQLDARMVFSTRAALANVRFTGFGRVAFQLHCLLLLPKPHAHASAACDASCATCQNTATNCTACAPTWTYQVLSLCVCDVSAFFAFSLTSAPGLLER